MSNPVIRINSSLCKQCGLCAYSCARKVLAGEPDALPQVVAPEQCNGCLMCFFRCPDFAIEVEVHRP